jgi:glycerophosphoryl diester phosphodiesterase
MERFRVAAWLLVVLPSSSVPAAAAEALRRPGVIAHRGVVSEAPENTRPAIARAIELGCAMAEIDLRYTADGEVVLFHDPSLERTTDGRGPLSAKTLAELRRLDAGAWYGPEFRGTRIPTFKEAVELARGRIQLYLDLKESDPLPVVRAVEALQARSFVHYRPYSYTALRRILAESPSSRVLIDIGDWAQAAPFVETLRREFPTASLSSDWANWTPPAVAEARKLGLPTLVNVLGAADTPENLRRAVELGFDYIQTDHPRELLEMLREGAASSSPSPVR